ncbi:MAG: bifunctional DNA-binding transcriptional regulator/O6-methylguanine-DNA methyltransferase Ada [Acidobacteria bacterium]|nr:bifunctional DNA-binding transcriptional regulator/O6-methylguanine-DNA methyltransferase Ada [Acidobacteriota bacterium]
MPYAPAHLSALDARWAAVLGRDRSSDGQFVYAVGTTGIYCRPSCPSRRPRRDHVVFFEAAGDAERAGYRACRRCRPAEPPPVDPWVDRIRRACAHLANAEARPSLSTLARHLGGSRYHLQRNFKRLVGITPREYADACRLARVKRGLRAGEAVTGALLDAGYGSASRFYERAAPKLGMPPRTYGRGGAGATIGYVMVASPLGRLLVAATPRGICSIALASSDHELESSLRAEYPAAVLAHASTGALTRWTRQVVDHLAGRLPRLDLPLDIRATSFQWQVWQALSSIPYGETRTYKEVAKTIGRPAAVRAVARACATNPVAVAIPCHRVVASDGRLAGYRWGRRRKQALIAGERRARRARAEARDRMNADEAPDSSSLRPLALDRSVPQVAHPLVPELRRRR